MPIRHLAAAVALIAAPSLVQAGDAAAGEKAFKACVACHVVQNDAGEILAGRNAKTGPNLYGLDGRHLGSADGFNYSEGMVEAGETGAVWTEADFVTYVADPTAFLKEVSGDDKARSKMTFKLKKADQAADIYAYIASLK